MNHQEMKAIVSLVGANVLTQCFLIEKEDKMGTHQSDNINPYAEINQWQPVEKETLIRKWNLERMDYITLFLRLKQLISL